MALKKKTENAILDFIVRSVQAMHESSKCLAVVLDLTKAFNTVSHNKLLDNLQQIVIRGSTLALMKNFLSDRSQTVRIGKDRISKLTAKMGVPQVTVLGPLFFFVYINIISKVKYLGGNLVCYVDGAAIIFTGENWDTKHKAEPGLKKIC